MSANAIAQAEAAPPDRTQRLQSLYNEAMEHSRLAKLHRSKARARFREFDRFKSALESMGIEVVVEDRKNPQMPLGGKSERNNEEPS